MSGIYTGVSNIARSVPDLYIGAGGVSRQISNGYVGVSNVAREMYSGKYHSVLDAYKDGAIIECMAYRDYDGDTGSKWSQSMGLYRFIPTTENVLTATGQGSIEHSYSNATSDHRAFNKTIYLFCNTVENAEMVCDLFKEKYTTVKGYDKLNDRYYNTLTIKSVGYLKKTCAEISLTIDYYRTSDGDYKYWAAYNTTNGYPNAYTVMIEMNSWFWGSYDSSCEARNLSTITFS